MKVSILYDRKCPICQHLVRASRLKSRTDQLELIDARNLTTPVIQGNDVSQLDFNKGFAVIVDGRLHVGADAAHTLAMLTHSSSLFFAVFKGLNQSATLSRLSYPLLRLGRRVLLMLLRIPKI